MEDTNRETVLVDVDMGDGGVTNDELERVEVELREGGVKNDELERVEVEVREGVGNGEEENEGVGVAVINPKKIRKKTLAKIKIMKIQL